MRLRAVPVTRIHSFQGAEHCAWEDITFLVVGPEETADWYLSDSPADFSGLLRTTFTNQTTLPEAASDTGLPVTAGSCGSARTTRRLTS